MILPSPYRVRLNRLRTGIGLFRSALHKWGLVPSVNCSFGAEEQTADHMLASCPLYHPPNGTLGLAALDDDSVDWLQTTALAPDNTKSAQTKKEDGNFFMTMKTAAILNLKIIWKNVKRIRIQNRKMEVVTKQMKIIRVPEMNYFFGKVKTTK